MILHRTSMQMIDYMHDFFCKGNKDYKQALSNVQDYNAAKILSNKAAVPSKDGQFRNNVMHLNVFWGVQMDIERYNYVDILFRKQRQGILYQEIQERENNKVITKKDKFEHACSEMVRGDKIDEAQIAEVEEEVGFIDGNYASGLGPDGQLLKRNDSDVMNNFFVHFNCRSFTDIDMIMTDQSNNGLVRRFESVKKNLSHR